MAPFLLTPPSLISSSSSNTSATISTSHFLLLLVHLTPYSFPPSFMLFLPTSPPYLFFPLFPLHQRHLLSLSLSIASSSPLLFTPSLHPYCFFFLPPSPYSYPPILLPLLLHRPKPQQRSKWFLYRRRVWHCHNSIFFSRFLSQFGLSSVFIKSDQLLRIIFFAFQKSVEGNILIAISILFKTANCFFFRGFGCHSSMLCDQVKIPKVVSHVFVQNLNDFYVLRKSYVFVGLEERSMPISPLSPFDLHFFYRPGKEG